MKKRLIWFKLYIKFSFGLIVSCVQTLYLAAIYHTFEKNSQKAKIVEAADRYVAAAQFECSGRWTISVECARSAHPKFKNIRRDLSILDDTHCQQSAEDEFNVIDSLKITFWKDE